MDDAGLATAFAVSVGGLRHVVLGEAEEGLGESLPNRVVAADLAVLAPRPMVVASDGGATPSIVWRIPSSVMPEQLARCIGGRGRPGAGARRTSPLPPHGAGHGAYGELLSVFNQRMAQAAVVNGAAPPLKSLDAFDLSVLAGALLALHLAVLLAFSRFLKVGGVLALLFLGVAGAVAAAFLRKELRASADAAFPLGYDNPVLRAWKGARCVTSERQASNVRRAFRDMALLLVVDGAVSLAVAGAARLPGTMWRPAWHVVGAAPPPVAGTRWPPPAARVAARLVVVAEPTAAGADLPLAYQRMGQLRAGVRRRLAEADACVCALLHARQAAADAAAAAATEDGSAPVGAVRAVLESEHGGGRRALLAAVSRAAAADESALARTYPADAVPGFDGVDPSNGPAAARAGAATSSCAALLCITGPLVGADAPSMGAGAEGVAASGRGGGAGDVGGVAVSAFAAPDLATLGLAGAWGEVVAACSAPAPSAPPMGSAQAGETEFEGDPTSFGDAGIYDNAAGSTV